MRYDIQKAGILRRVSAGIFDAILLLVLVCGLAWGLSEIMDLNEMGQTVVDYYDQYAEEYGIDFSIDDAAMATMPEEDLVKYEEALNAMNNDDSAVYALMRFAWSGLLMVSLSVLIGHLLLEFLVPVLLKNGQTLGKKVFGIALMRKDGIMVTNFTMFVRSILGKCTIEVMVTVLILFMMIMGSAGMLGPIILLGLAVVQICLLFFHPYNAVLHDLLACTVEVDMSSQLIFESTEAMLEYQKQYAAEKAERADY